MSELPAGEAPLADEPFAPEIASSEVVFDGAVWDVRRERFAFGDGELVREFVAHTGAVAVLAIDDDDRMLAIRQYRHPIRERNWELPAGLLDIEGEDPLEAGKRELAEEADLVAADWEPLIQLHTTPGGSDEIIHVFRATGLSAAPEVFARDGEEADIVTRWVAVEEAVDAVLAGRARNGIFMAAVLAEHARRTRARG
ncbi:ADP-ribose pyrophosphatase [Microcella alkaliphila]|uniref:ADP-ribose pyrophosphatase n=1 Tax=Microcella alkaliphila TaxID=279828 RepID=A0A4Q7TPU6_9MICO|nr:NUDIX hydrolase [Microcella alkaliphila]RZT62603.1 ADP-ribose pyrophosphatase [Microcella alkaliphila]